MHLWIVEDAPHPSAYANVPIAFEVRERLDVVAVHVGRPLPSPCPTVPVPHPFVKDYDAIAGSHPRNWPSHDDFGPWRCVTALADDQPVARAAFAVAGEEATLWDIRVAPRYRRRGLGSTLLARVEDLTWGLGARRVYVETQDINVPACRFYASHGYVIRSIRPNAYPALPDEVRIVFHKPLS